jgi:hypothetical protein
MGIEDKIKLIRPYQNILEFDRTPKSKLTIFHQIKRGCLIQLRQPLSMLLKIISQ